MNRNDERNIKYNKDEVPEVGWSSRIYTLEPREREKSEGSGLL
jgi:hypothetical protein